MTDDKNIKWRLVCTYESLLNSDLEYAFTWDVFAICSISYQCPTLLTLSSLLHKRSSYLSLSPRVIRFRNMPEGEGVSRKSDLIINH